MLQDILAALPWQTITPVGLSAGFAWIVIRGKLIPRSWVDKSTRDQEKRVEYLEKTVTEQAATIASLAQQNAELSASAKLSVALLQSLQSPNNSNARGLTPGSNPNVAPPPLET